MQAPFTLLSEWPIEDRVAACTWIIIAALYMVGASPCCAIFLAGVLQAAQLPPGGPTVHENVRPATAD